MWHLGRLTRQEWRAKLSLQERTVPTGCSSTIKEVLLMALLDQKHTSESRLSSEVQLHSQVSPALGLPLLSLTSSDKPAPQWGHHQPENSYVTVIHTWPGRAYCSSSWNRGACDRRITLLLSPCHGGWCSWFLLCYCIHFHASLRLLYIILEIRLATTVLLHQMSSILSILSTWPMLSWAHSTNACELVPFTLNYLSRYILLGRSMNSLGDCYGLK